MYNNPYPPRSEEYLDWEQGYGAGYWGYTFDPTKMSKEFLEGYNFFKEDFRENCP